jgi:WXG100 family type VII secretion target
MTLQVDVEDLVTSGVAVTGHGENMAMTHAVADNRIDAAQAGWRGLSGAALLSRSAQWMTTTSALVTNLSDHAQGLHTSAQRFHEMDQRNGWALDELA